MASVKEQQQNVTNEGRKKDKRWNRTVSSVSHTNHGLCQMLRDVRHQVLLLSRLLAQDPLPELPRLLQVAVLHLALVRNHAAAPDFPARLGILRRLVETVEAGRVVGRQAVVAARAPAPTLALALALALALEEAAGAVAAEGVEAVLGPVDGQLREVGAEAVALRVLVGEGTDLQDFLCVFVRDVSKILCLESFACKIAC